MNTIYGMATVSAELFPQVRHEVRRMLVEAVHAKTDAPLVDLTFFVNPLERKGMLQFPAAGSATYVVAVVAHEVRQ